MTDLELAITGNTGVPLTAPNGDLVMINDYGEVGGNTDGGRAYILVSAEDCSEW